MNGVIGLGAAVVAALVVSGCQTEASKQAHPKGQAEIDDDSAVVSAAMLAFFDDTDWNAADWDSGDYVVIRPDWSKFRPVFNEALESAIHWAKEYDKDSEKKEAPQLLAIKDEVAASVGTYKPARVGKPADLKLDERIVVSDVEWSTYFRDENKDIKNLQGKTGSIRVAGGISPPGYSRDGKYACVSMSAPWSMHSAHLTFLVERADKGWKVVHVQAMFFV